MTERPSHVDDNVSGFPVVPLRDIVVFPHTMVPFVVGRKASLLAVEQALAGDKRLFEYENVKLRFADDALEAIADLAIQRKIGARGLRMIMEELMLEMMFSLPSQKDVKEVVITRDVALNKSNPLVVMEKAG